MKPLVQIPEIPGIPGLAAPGAGESAGMTDTISLVCLVVSVGAMAFWLYAKFYLSRPAEAQKPMAVKPDLRWRKAQVLGWAVAAALFSVYLPFRDTGGIEWGWIFAPPEPYLAVPVIFPIWFWLAVGAWWLFIRGKPR